MSAKLATTTLIMGSLLTGIAAQADPIVYDSFTGYPDNALISASPAGAAVGLTGDWALDAGNFFYVNMTEADHDSGTGKAVYDMPYDDNGARTAQREVSQRHELASQDGDRFYASFRIEPARGDGHMLFRLNLERLDGGGQPDLSFGIKDGNFVVGNGGVHVDLSGGMPAPGEMRIVLRAEYGDAGTGPDDLEVVTLWVDPDNENSTPVIDRVEADLLNRGGARLTGVSMRGDQMDGLPAFFDDLVIGHEFADVIQESPTDELTHHAGVNGLFYNPDNPGHGFNFVMHRFGFTAYYYGHTANGERLWLVSENFEGDLEFGRPFAIELYEVGYGTFGQPLLPATPWGTLAITLADCDSGHASMSGIDGDLEMDFVRLSAMPELGCN